MDRQQTGQAAEEQAAAFLERQGVRIHLRNYRCRLGELDIVGEHKGVLIVAEVRTRASDAYGGAAASIDTWKQHCIVRATTHLLQRRKDFARLPVRFDVIVVSDLTSESPRIEWLKHAFEAAEAVT